MPRVSTSSNPDDDPLQILKAVTATDHSTLEGQPLLRRLMDPTLATGEYQRILLRMHACISACEWRLGAKRDLWQARGLNWSQRLVKTEWLCTDLAQLEAVPVDLSAAHLDETPAVDSLAAAAGMFYVLEGSTLGAQVILSALRNAPADPARGALRFFLGYGAQTLPMWHEWRADCRQILAPDAALTQSAADTATATFRFFHDNFSD